MAVYEYKAVDLDASALAGTVTADTARQAREMLRDRGLVVAEMREVRSEEAPGWLAARHGRAAQGEVAAFVRELATLLGAGIPLLEALQTLRRQHRRRFRAVVEQLADQVAAGSSLAEALARQAAYFDELAVSIVRVGESTGELDVALKRLAEFKEKRERLRSRVITALLYPAVVCVVGLSVMVFLMTYVVPNLLGTLTLAGKDLPAITRVVKGVSDLLLTWWWALLLGVLALATAARAVLRSRRGRERAERLLLALPVLGELVRKENTSRMAVVLAALLRSGLQFVDALRVTQRTLASRIFRRALEDYEQAVQAGRDVAAPLEATGVFSPLVVRMLAVGQHTGEVESMLEQLAVAYEQEVAVSTQRLAAVLEPLLIVVLAILVGCVAFATILPILEASNVL